MRKNDAPIIIKRAPHRKHGFHGGNWKVALADFMTSMFIFCLAMWLLNISTKEQKIGIADFPSPESVSRQTSGSGGVLGGLSIIADGVFVESGGPPSVLTYPEGGQPIELPEEDFLEESFSDLTPEEIERLLVVREQLAFARAEKAIQDIAQSGVSSGSVQQIEDLTEQITVTQDEQGLRITLRDLEGKPMFDLGSSRPLPRTQAVLREMAPVIAQLPNAVKMLGHTDSTPYAAGDGSYSNWELSSDRANAARRELVRAGLDSKRFIEVVGLASTRPYEPQNPEAASNRRLEIVLVSRQYAGTASGSGRPLAEDAVMTAPRSPGVTSLDDRRNLGAPSTVGTPLPLNP